MMLFIMRGCSNTGKDHFCNSNFTEHCVLSSDKIRLLLLNSVEDQTKNGFVFEHLRHVLDLRLRFGCEYTVVNATCLKFKDVTDYINLARKYGAKVTFISIDPPDIKDLIQRNNARGEAGGLRVPESVFAKHLMSYWSAMPRFEEEARNSIDVKWVRINQDWEIVDEI